MLNRDLKNLVSGSRVGELEGLHLQARTPGTRGLPMREKHPHRYRPAALLVLSVTLLVLAACGGQSDAPSTSPPLSGGSLDQYDLVFAVAGDSRSSAAWMNYDPKPDYRKYINTTALGALNSALIEKRQGREDFFFMFLGDMAIYGGAPIFNTFKQVMSPLKDSGIPMYPAIGNHEVRFFQYEETKKAEAPARALRAQQAYQAAFEPPWTMPSDASFLKDYQNLAYTFRRGSSVFVVMDAFYVNEKAELYKKGYYSDVQLKWLQDTLEGYKNDTTVTHRIILSHQPVFDAFGGNGRLYDRYDKKPPPGSTKDRPTAASARSNWIMWALLDTYKVDAFFSGHSHFYHRWNVVGGQFRHKYGQDFPPLGSEFDVSDIKRYIPDTKVWETTIPHVVTGSCGAEIEAFGGNNVPAAARADEYNFAIVYVKGGTVTVDVYSYGDDNGLWAPKMIDKFRIIENHLVTTLPLNPEPT